MLRKSSNRGERWATPGSSILRLASGMAPYLELNTSTEGEALCTRCAVGRPSRPASATRASAEYVSAAVAVTVEGVSGRKP